MIFYRNCRFLTLLVACVLLSGSITAQDKTEKRNSIVSVKIKVVDENGNGLPNANVVIGDEVIQTLTDDNGFISLIVFPNDFVTISSRGYEKNVSLIKDILTNNTIQLQKSKLFKTSDDDVPLPFISLKKRYLPTNSIVLESRQLDKYPSTDLRNSFTGLVPGVEVLELTGQPGLSSEEKKLGYYGITDKITISARGREMMHIIDDIPTDLSETPLDPGEIESVTIIKDIVGKAMYGPAGADGIIYIKTKHGSVSRNILKVDIESGVSVIDRFPEWVSGADYASLSNKARANNQLSPYYNTSDISSYGMNDPYNQFHPSVNFREMMLKDSRSFRRASITSSGGTENVQYFAFLGYNGEGDVYKIGPVSDYNRINARSNIDIRINDFLKVKFGFYGGLSYRRSANYGGSKGESTINLIEFNAVIKDVTTIPPVAFPVYANDDPSLDKPWYGVSNMYKINPIGELVEGGFYTEQNRIGTTNVSIDYDMSHLLPGLKSTTFVGFNITDVMRIGKAEYYPAYIVTPAADSVQLTFVHEGISTPNFSNLHDYYSQRFSAFENLNYSKTLGSHDIQMALTYYISKISRHMIDTPEKQQNGIWTGVYSYDDKYSIQGVLNYAGNSGFIEGSRYELFPSAGISWIASEENFMSEINFIDYLKLHAEAGIIGYNNFMYPYYYRDNWNQSKGSDFGPYPGQQWFGSGRDNSVYKTTPGRIGNSNLTWEKRKEFSVGIEALMFNHKLTLEANYYNNLRDGEITQLVNSLPYVAGFARTAPVFNYNKIRLFGVETGIRFSDRVGNFKYSIGVNATAQDSKYLQIDEPNYRFDYQSMTGTPIDTYWGLTYLGKFQSDDEASETPQLFDDILHEGDLKYADINGDGVVDDNDMSALGHTTPRLFYAVNLNLNYKNFDLTIIGTGRAFYDLPLTNRYFWNGWGDDNYSVWVKDNLGEAYPRLTYNRVNNNFVNSDFWLTEGDYFKIQNVELSYTLPPNVFKVFSGGKGVRFFLRGANLLTFSKVKYVDPESIDSGVEVYPLFKTFTAGIKLTF